VTLFRPCAGVLIESEVVLGEAGNTGPQDVETAVKLSGRASGAGSDSLPILAPDDHPLATPRPHSFPSVMCDGDFMAWVKLKERHSFMGAFDHLRAVDRNFISHGSRDGSNQRETLKASCRAGGRCHWLWANTRVMDVTR
jgi:hypothetical protein